MKKIIAVLALIGATTAFAAEFSSDSYLYWMIDTTSANNFDWAYAKVNAGGEYLSIAYEGFSTAGNVDIYKDNYDSSFNLWASLAGVDSSKSIIIELFNDGDVAIAKSSTSLSLASAQDYISASRMSIPTGVWAPSFTIPEPNSALLMLIGAAMLGLKRKRAKKA